MDNQGLQTDFLKLVLQSGHHNPRWRAQYLNCTDCRMLASIEVIFTIFVPILFPVTGKYVSDIDRTASPVKSKDGGHDCRAIRTVTTQNNAKLKENGIFRLV